MSEFFTKLKVDSFLVIPLAVILISFFFVLIPNTTKAEIVFYEENFDFYSDGYYLKDIPNWTITSSDWQNSGIVSNDFSKSNPFSLKFHYLTRGWHTYHLVNNIDDDFIFSFDFLPTNIDEDGFMLTFVSTSPGYITEFQLATSPNNGKIQVRDNTGWVDIYEITSSYTWYNVKLEFSFEDAKIRVNIDNTGWSDWINFTNLNTEKSLDLFEFYYISKSYGHINTSFYFDNIKMSSGTPGVPWVWENFCGADAGTFRTNTPTELCEIGNPSAVVFDGAKWTWDCVSGPISQSCRAYLSTTYPVDGTCGAWDGQTFDIWPPVEELCEIKASLVVPSMVETINGYTWTCSGINGGSTAYCSGNKTSPPLMPELPPGSLDDCTGLGVLESLVCNIGNTIKTIFLPSSEKINELNETINKMSSKFPFSYISKATETFNNVKENITETSMLELSIMGSEKSSIDFSTIAFFDYIKMLTTILIVLVFSFWLIRFIKHIF